MSRAAFERIRKGLLEATDYVAGKPTRVRVTNVAVTRSDLKTVRRRLKLTQREFAPLVGMSVSGLRKVEQGQRPLQGALATLVTVMQREPAAVLRAIGHSPSKREGHQMAAE